MRMRCVCIISYHKKGRFTRPARFYRDFTDLRITNSG